MSSVYLLFPCFLSLDLESIQLTFYLFIYLSRGSFFFLGAWEGRPLIFMVEQHTETVPSQPHLSLGLFQGLLELTFCVRPSEGSGWTEALWGQRPLVFPSPCASHHAGTGWCQIYFSTMDVPDCLLLSSGWFREFLKIFIYLFIFGFIGSSLWCVGFSSRWLLLLQSTGSRRVGFSSCGTWAQ